MTSRPSPATPPAPTRLMLARPETLDVVGGLERFMCLDIMGGTKISRASCAARYQSETARASKGPRQSATDGAVPHMPCVGCPVGKLHSDEQRKGAVPRLQVVQGRYAGGAVAAPTRAVAPRAPGVAVVPEAVVPARRPSAPTAPKTPDPDHADAQQGGPVGNSADGAARSGSRERASPAGAEHPAPPSGEQVSAGRRPRKIGRPFANRLLRHPVTGEEMAGSAWAQRLGISHQLISWRLGKGLPMEQVLAPHKHPAISAGVKAAKARVGAASEPKPDASMVTCCECGAVVPRTSNRQQRCSACSYQARLDTSRDAKRRTRELATDTRSTPVQAPERPRTGVAAGPGPEAAVGRAGAPGTASPSTTPGTTSLTPHLDALCAELLGLAMQVVTARDLRDEASASYRALAERYRARLAEIVNGANT